MPWPFVGNDPGMMQLAGFMNQLPRQNQNMAPPGALAPQSQVPQGFYGNPPMPMPNPMRSPFQGGGAVGSWGGASPPMQAGLGDISRILGALAVPGGGMVGPGAQMGAMAFPGASGGAGGVPQASAQGLANLPPVRPPGAAQYGIGPPGQYSQPMTGILGNAQPQAPGAAPYGVGPQGTGAQPPAPTPKPKPKPKPKPAARKRPQGDQAQYSSKGTGTNWEPGERGAPVGGQFSSGFGYEAWRRPKR